MRLITILIPNDSVDTEIIDALNQIVQDKKIEMYTSFSQIAPSLSNTEKESSDETDEFADAIIWLTDRIPKGTAGVQVALTTIGALIHDKSVNKKYLFDRLQKIANIPFDSDIVSKRTLRLIKVYKLQGLFEPLKLILKSGFISYE